MHALANPEQDLPRLADEIRRRRWGDPDFMHPRKIPTIEMLHILGFKLRTYNLEDVDQMYIESLSRAEMRASILEDFRQGNLAYTQDDINKSKSEALLNFQRVGKTPPKDWEERIDKFWEKRKEQTDEWRTPRSSTGYKLAPDGAIVRDDPHELYYVHKEASFMLHRMDDPIQWWPGAKPFVEAAQIAKQKLTGLNLGWSAYHQLHMLPIGAAETQSLVMRKFLEGTGTMADLRAALADTLSLGIYNHVKSLFHGQRLLNWYQSGDPKFLQALNPHEREMLALHKEGGFIPAISHERQIQIEQMLLQRRGLIAQTAKARPISFGLDLIHGVLGARPYQQYLFGRVIPSLKQFAWDRAALALKAAHPELWRPQNWLKRRQELRKITQQIDAHFGERNLRLSFEDPIIKQVGQATLLSYTWNTSMLDTYGGAIHDLEKATSLQVADAIKKERVRPVAERFLTNKLIYGVNLQVMSALTSAMIATLVGVGVKSLWDLIYPNVGPDPDHPGELKRVKVPFWLTTDIFGFWKDMAMGGGFWPGALMFAANKMQSGLSMFYDVWIRGRDYWGNDISAPGTPIWEALEERVKASLIQLGPFILQQAWQPGMTPKDVMMTIMGLGPASRWAERTEGENMIMSIYQQYHAPGATETYVHQQRLAREQYREGLLRNNSAETLDAVKKMREVGMSEKAIVKLISSVHKNVHSSMEEMVFKHSLDADEQGRVLHLMQGDELRRYWHLAKPEARKKYHDIDPERPGLIKYLPD